MTNIVSIITSRDEAQLQQAVRDERVLSRCTDRDWTPLHLAAWEGWSEGVEFLLNAGADINAQDQQGLTALHLAAFEGHTVCVGVLIRAGGASLITDSTGVATPRHWALLAGHPHIARLLAVAQQSDDVDNWLHIACAQSAVDTVETLLSWGDDIDRLNGDGESALGVAVRHGHTDIVQFLIREGASVSTQSADMLPLGVAIMQGHLDVADLLLRSGAGINDVDSNGRRALHWATRSTTGNYELIQYCMDRNASLDLPSEGGNLPLHWALAHGDESIATTVLARTTHVDQPNEQGITPLFWASMNSSETLVQALLDRKANVDWVDNAGNTALHWAARNPEAAVITLLVNARSNPDHQGASGATPLHWAVRSGLIDNVLALLAMNANCNSIDTAGDSVLHWCARYGEEDLISPLVDAGVNIDHTNHLHETALLFAVRANNEFVMEALLDEGADVDIANHSGVSPRRIVEEILLSDTITPQQGSLIQTMARYVDDIPVPDTVQGDASHPARETLEIIPIKKQALTDE